MTTRTYANGSTNAYFDELVPCSQVKDKPGYIDIQYSDYYTQNIMTETGYKDYM